MKVKSSGKHSLAPGKGAAAEAEKGGASGKFKSNASGNNSLDSTSTSSQKSSSSLVKSPSKKTTSKHLDARSPTKKSLDYLSKIAAATEGEDGLGEGEVPSGISSPGLRKYTRDISDVAGKRLPHIVSCSFCKGSF